MANQHTALHTSIDVFPTESSALIALISTTNLTKVFVIALMSSSQILHLRCDLLTSRSCRKKNGLRGLSVDILLRTFQKSLLVPCFASAILPINSTNITPFCFAVTNMKC